MPHPRLALRLAAVSAAVVLPIALSACSSGKSDNSAGSSSTGSSMTSSSSTMTSPTDSASSSAMAGGSPFGTACADVPKSGAGSFDGMSTAPVATAASSNPVLSTLVKAVTAAGLGDTLNSQKAITVFAPANSAFAKIDSATLNKLLADPKGDLTKILTYHVLPERLTPDQLAGSHKTLEGGDVTVSGSGQNFTVGANKANVVCGNVQTANATVYIIDSVLMPPAS